MPRNSTSAARKLPAKAPSLDRQLIQRISRLKTDAAAAEQKIAKSHHDLYLVLAKCLSLVAKHGKYCPEFKVPIQDGDQTYEYPENKGGPEPSEFKPVIWQVFKCPPAQTLYRYTSVLTLIEFIAAQKGVEPTSTAKTVELMKSYGSIDRMVDARKALKRGEKTPEELEDERQRARDEWQAEYQAALNSLSQRPRVQVLDPEKAGIETTNMLALFVARPQPNGRMSLYALDPVKHPEDLRIVEMWQEQQDELGAAIDTPTMFLRELITLAKAVKEVPRPKNDRSAFRVYQRRISFEPAATATRCLVGPVDTGSGVSLSASTQGFPFPLDEPVCLNRTPSENDEAIVLKCVKRDLRQDENAVRVLTGNYLGKRELAQGIRGKFLFGDEAAPEAALLVTPSRLEGQQMMAAEAPWDGSITLSKAALKGMMAKLEAYKKYQKSVAKERKRKGGKTVTVHETKKLGHAFWLDVSGAGLVISNFDGKDSQEVSGVVSEGSAALAEKCRIRTDDLLACIRAMLKVAGANAFTLRYNNAGDFELGASSAVGDYAFRLTNCDEQGKRAASLDAIHQPQAAMSEAVA